MAVLHKDLSGAELHEPKGIESASADEVYFADGSGSGEWKALTEYLHGLNEYSLTATMDDISAVNNRVYFRVPTKSEMVGLSVVLDGAIATANDVLSVYVEGVLFADSLTVNFSGSGAGIASDASFATANTVDAGDIIEIRSDGASDNVTKAFVQLRLRAKA